MVAQRSIRHNPCEIGGMNTGLDRDRSGGGLDRDQLRIRLKNVLAEGDDSGDTAYADLVLA